MVIVGLTGSIGMGKSSASAMLQRMGVAAFESDLAVHRLLSSDRAAVAAVTEAFPGTVSADGIDRRALGAQVFGDRAALRRLETLLHPLVRRDMLSFLRRACRRREPLVVLDVPLLFETGGERLCDVVVVVSAPGFLQRQRVMARAGMTAARLASILARQTSDREKRRRADFVIVTGLDKGYTWRALARLVDELRTRRGRCWPPSPYRMRRHARSRPRY